MPPTADTSVPANQAAAPLLTSAPDSDSEVAMMKKLLHPRFCSKARHDSSPIPGSSMTTIAISAGTAGDIPWAKSVNQSIATPTAMTAALTSAGANFPAPCCPSWLPVGTSIPANPERYMRKTASPPATRMSQKGSAIRTNQRVQEKSPMRADATTGVMPPASRAVEPKRLRDPMAIITPLFNGCWAGIRHLSITCSYTCTRMAPRVEAEGSAKVNAAKDSSIWTYSARGLPRDRWMRYPAMRFASPDCCTPNPRVRMPMRKYGTGCENPYSAASMPGTAPTSVSRTTARNAGNRQRQRAGGPEPDGQSHHRQRPLTLLGQPFGSGSDQHNGENRQWQTKLDGRNARPVAQRLQPSRVRSNTAIFNAQSC